jgi:hypothetical protein
MFLLAKKENKNLYNKSKSQLSTQISAFFSLSVLLSEKILANR